MPIPSAVERKELESCKLHMDNAYYFFMRTLTTKTDRQGRMRKAKKILRKTAKLFSALTDCLYDDHINKQRVKRPSFEIAVASDETAASGRQHETPVTTTATQVVEPEHQPNVSQSSVND